MEEYFVEMNSKEYYYVSDRVKSSWVYTEVKDRVFVILERIKERNEMFRNYKNLSHILKIANRSEGKGEKWEVKYE